MSVYRYKIQLSYVNGESSETTKIDVACIKSFCIERDYDQKNMPIAFMELTLDKNLVDTIILNATKNSKFLLVMANYPEDGDGVAKVCVAGEFAYFLQDDVNYNKDIDYSEYEKEANNGTERKDKYRTIMVGLMLQSNLDNNKRQINSITYNTTIMDIVASITNHMAMLIEPFKYNKTMEQLIIPPLESVSKALEYLNRMSAFYDTKFRYFLDYDTGYLLSCSGKPVKKRTEKYSTILIDIRNVTSTGAFEQGMREDRTQNCYVIPISTTDTVYQTNQATNQDFNNITAILDISREKAEAKTNSIQGTINRFKMAANKIKTASKNIKNKFSNLGNTLNTMKDQMISDMNKTLNVTVEVNGVAVQIDNIFSKPGITTTVKNQYIQNIINTAKEVESLYNEVKNLPNTYDEIKESIYQNACNACSFDNYINGVAPANYSDNVGGMNTLYTGIIKTSDENAEVISSTFTPALEKINQLNSKIDNMIKDINALPSNIKSATSSGDDSSSYIDVSEAKELIPTLLGLKPDITECATGMNNTFGYISEIPTSCVSAANSCNAGIQDIISTPNILQNEFNGTFSSAIGNNTLASTIVSSAGIASATSSESIANISLNGFNNINNSLMDNINSIGKSFMTDIQLAVDGMNDIADIGTSGISSFNTDVLLADAADYALKKTKLLRVPNDNVNLVKQIISEIQLSSARLTINKNGLDTLAITPNKEYIVKNFDTHSNRNGKFLLANKKEVYVREDDSFIMNTILTFRQIPYAEKDIWSSLGTQAVLYGISRALK